VLPNAAHDQCRFRCHIRGKRQRTTREILYCGVCHSDLHFARNEWHFTQYPAVPGHEIVGRVTAVGSGVTKFKVGDTVGVGCLVDSCRTCPECRAGLEQFCGGMVMTYGSMDKHLGAPTLGGYAQSIVVTEEFVLRMPANLDLAAAAPLLCAGITTYSPLRKWKVGPGQKVGIVGLGGLGHMGVKFARAFGAHVVLFTTSPARPPMPAPRRARGGGLEGCGRDGRARRHVRLHPRYGFGQSRHQRLPHAVEARRPARPGRCARAAGGGGAVCAHLRAALVLGLAHRRSAETQEMLDFCGQHGITADVEMIRMDQINAAYERMLQSDVKYRFVIDLATLFSRHRAGRR
jgi:uncharacterized zinc-type alcohol dehydrogenase-like protein